MSNSPSHHHHHHRQRMRERYLRDGFDSFADHELLEMMLAAATPRKNTNDQAHALLEHFGSLRNVLDAGVEELEQIQGIGQVVAISLKVNQELGRRYLRQSIPNSKTYTKISSILEFLYPKFLGQKSEHVYMLLFDNRMQMLDCTLISIGMVNRSDVPIGSMVKRALNKNASNAIVAHNHPHGLAIPSDEDIAVTDDLLEAFGLIGVNLIEHLVISEEGFWPIVRRTRGAVPDVTLPVGVRSDGSSGFYNIEESEYTFSSLVEQHL